ncbi:tetratricopeptide repeat protein, partial [bacterium]|nr:tetratricopeptide repeat protein [bacterium]
VTGLRTGVPMELERIINKTLNKDPANRFQSCAELMVDLKLLAGELTPAPAIKKIAVKTKQKVKFIKIVNVTSVLAVILLAFFLGKNFFTTKKNPQIKSIAVLPLENLSGDREQEYFSDGMTDELIATLAKIRSLRVISRTSVMRYKKTDKSMPEIAEEMDVDYLIEGTVLRSDGRVRITVQLIEGKSDSHIWAESYKRDLQDVLMLQSEVAMAIVREIKLELTTDQEERLLDTKTVNPEAHESYLQGQFHLSGWKKGGLEKAIKYFQKAIEVDHNYALAYVGLSNAYVFGGYFGYIPLKEAQPKMSKFLKRAFEIDDTIPEAHQLLATIKFYWEWDWVGAEEEFERALELNPNLVGNDEYAWYLAGMGRFDEAISEAKRTLRLDPYSFWTNWTLAFTYFYARQYNQAISQMKKVLELELNDIRSYYNLAFFYGRMGKFDDAVRNWQRAMTLSGATTEEITALGRAYNESGSRGYWTWFLERTKDQVTKAKLYTRLDDKDQAMTLLEKAYKKHSQSLWSIKISPDFDPLRSDPRFQDLLRRMKFPEKKPLEANNKRKINDR